MSDEDTTAERIREYYTNRSEQTDLHKKSFNTQFIIYEIKSYVFLFLALLTIISIILYNFEHLQDIVNIINIIQKSPSSSIQSITITYFISLLSVTVPTFILFWILFNKSQYYSKLSIVYQHKRGLVPFINYVRGTQGDFRKDGDGSTEYKDILSTLYKDIIYLDNTKKPDDTKKVLKLLEEINKIITKK